MIRLLILLLAAVTAHAANVAPDVVPRKVRPPLPPALPALPHPTVKKAKPTAWISPRFAATRSTCMIKPRRYRESARHRVIYGPLPKLAFWRTTEPREGLHTEIHYEKDVPVYWPGPGGEDVVVFSDVVTVTAFQQADYPAILEHSDNLVDFAVTAMWGTYPYNQPVSTTWIRPTEQVRRDYPKVFFRAFRPLNR